MHSGDKDEEKKKGQRWWHYYAAVKNMGTLNNSYYTQGQEGRLYWMGEHKPNDYWEVAVTGLTLSLTFCLHHPENYNYFEESNPKRTHNSTNKKSNLGIFNTWCQSHFELTRKGWRNHGRFCIKMIAAVLRLKVLTAYPPAAGAELKGSISSLRKPFTETLNSAARGENDRKWLRGPRWPQKQVKYVGCIKELYNGRRVGGVMDEKATLQRRYELERSV